MKKIVRHFPLFALLLTTAFLSGCAIPTATDDSATANTKMTPSVTTDEKTTPSLVNPAQTNEQIALKEGMDLFNNGDYNGTIRRLSTANEIWSGGTQAIQLDALKYMAFSYCLTSRQTLCKSQFEKALKLNPAFDLAPGEKGHPLWGPSFDRAKKAK